MWTIPHRFLRLDTWSPTGNTVWEDYGTFRRQNLARGSRSLGEGLKAMLPNLISCALFVDAR